MRLARRVLPVNLMLLVIGLVDLATTLYWLHVGRIIEANPIMAAVLDLSLPLFIAVKLSTLLAYVVVMEWYRRNRNPIFARLVGNITVTAYAGIYSLSFCWVNRALLFG